MNEGRWFNSRRALNSRAMSSQCADQSRTDSCSRNVSGECIERDCARSLLSPVIGSYSGSLRSCACRRTLYIRVIPADLFSINLKLYEWEHGKWQEWASTIAIRRKTNRKERASGRPNWTKLNDQTNSEARFLCDCSIKVLWELIFYNRGNCSIIYMSQAECGMGFVQGFWILYDFFLPNQVFPETKKIMIRRSHNHNFDYLYTGSVPDSQSWQTISWMTKVTKNMLSYYYCPELLIKFYFPQGLLSKSLS